MNFLTKKILVISVAIIVLVGIVPSVFLEDWQWLSRSGSLLTAYGIYLAFKELTENLRPTRDIKILEKLEEIAIKPYDELTLSERIHKAVHRDPTKNLLLRYRVESQNLLADAVEPSVKVAELFVLLAGTFIWGYGDLLCHLFSECQ